MDEDQRRRDYILERSTQNNFKYALLLWDELFKKSELISAQDLAVYGYPGQHGEEVRVFTGYFLHLGEEIGLRRAGINAGTAVLTSMEAITVLRRASPKTPTVVILSYRPTTDQFNEFRTNLGAMSRSISPNRYEAMRNRITTLEEKVAALEKFARITTDRLLKLENKPF